MTETALSPPTATPGAPLRSYYAATANPAPQRPALAGAASADVCIVGGGLCGTAAALTLAERGYRVVLLEAERIGFGASGRSGGQLHSGQRRDVLFLESRFGREAAKRLWALADEAKRYVRDMIARHGIACDWRPGLILAIHKRRYVEEERRLVDHLARHYGYEAIDWLDRDALADAIGTPVYHAGLRDRGAGHLHSLNLTLGFAAAAERHGAVIHEQSRVVRLRRGARHRVETAQGAVDADAVLLAGNGYLHGLAPEIEARTLPIKNYIIATAPLGPALTARIPGGEAVADTRFVVHYWRPTPDGRLLFGGGETYDAEPADIAGFVRRHLARIYPDLAQAPVDYAWAGTLAVTANRLPFIKRLAPGLYGAGGFSGQGLAIAPFAGHVVARAIMGDSERFDVFARLPSPAFPGGRRLRQPLLALAMGWYRLRDVL